MEVATRLSDIQLQETTSQISTLSRNLETTEAQLKSSKISVAAFESRDETSAKHIAEAESRISELILEADYGVLALEEALHSKDLALKAATEKAYTLTTLLAQAVQKNRDLLKEGEIKSLAAPETSARAEVETAVAEALLEAEKQHATELENLRKGYSFDGTVGQSESVDKLRSELAAVKNAADAVAISAADAALNEARAISELQAGKRCLLLHQQKEQALEATKDRLEAAYEIANVNILQLKTNMSALEKKHNAALESLRSKKELLAAALSKKEESSETPTDPPRPSAAQAPAEPEPSPSSRPHPNNSQAPNALVRIRQNRPDLRIGVLVVVLGIPTLLIIQLWVLYAFYSGIGLQWP